MSKPEKRVSIILGGGWVVTNDKATTYYDKQGYEYSNIELGHKALYSKEEAYEALTLLRHFCPNATQVRYLQYEVQTLAPSEVEDF